MPAPPPFKDPVHLEVRLLAVVEMLDSAIAEVRRAMADVQKDTGPDTEAGPANQGGTAAGDTEEPPHESPGSTDD
jgi:hypothetical protein